MLKSSVPESSKFFSCELCHYNTSRYSQYTRHLSTAKHKNISISTICQQSSTNVNTKSSTFTCACGKKYKERTGLWKHKKTCDINSHDDNIKNELTNDNIKEEPNNELNTINMTDKELIAFILKENSEFKKLLVEVVKNGTHNTTNNNNNSHSHNKTFNLNFFLNEQCKDAMNIMDFVSMLKVDFEDLENTGRLGFVDGISKLIMKNLKALDKYKRPIHCSDLKRETLYIKDNDKWEKDNDDKDKIKKVIKDVAYENIKQIGPWTKKHPGCQYADSRKNDLYLNIVSNAMSGGTAEETEKNLNNIIRNIAKQVTIEK
jgi:hypothetical protein